MNLKLPPLWYVNAELARRSHLDFMRYMWQRPFDPFVEGKHTREICARIDKAFADFRAGKSSYLAIMVPQGHGKLLADDTPVLTPEGWASHGDLVPGDYVYGCGGVPVRVIAVDPVGDFADMEVEFSDGTKICAHHMHEWVVYDKCRHRDRIVETWEIDHLGLSAGKNSGNRFRVDHNEVIQNTEKSLLIHPYVLGCWLGDGSTTKNCITHSPQDFQMVEKIKRLGYAETCVCVHGKTGVHTTYFHALYKQLVELGLLGQRKYIPGVYLRSSVEQRLELLAGLIDTDGYVAKNGKVCFSNANKDLIDDVKELVNSLGCEVGIHKYDPVTSSSGIVGKQPVYQLLFKPLTEIPTALPRKKTTQLCELSRRRSIVGIKMLEKPKPGRCIQVDGGLYLVGETNIPTHNSDIVSRYLPAHFVGEFPDYPVIVTGYSSSLTEGFSSDCQNILRDERYNGAQGCYPGIQISKRKQSVDEWWIEGRASKLYWPGLTGSITGKRAALGVCDDFFSGREEAESETIRDQRWNTIVNDFLSRAHTHTIVIILATPWHTDDPFGRIRKKMAESDRFPRFEFLKFPAFRDEYPTGTLFPERYDHSWYEAQKEFLGRYGTASLLQCEPVIEHGNLFEVDGVKFYDRAPDGIRWTRGWDLASSEKQRVKDDPDFTASIKMGVKWMSGGGPQPMPILYFDDFTCDLMEAPKRDAKIQTMAIADGEAVEVGIEAYGPYKDAFKNLESAVWGLRKVTKVQLPGDKVTRAGMLEPAFHAGNVYMRKAPWNDKLLQFFREFPGGTHDDPIDAAVTAFALHKPFVKHVIPDIQTIEPISFNIHWGKKDERNALHYGAVVLRKDLSLWIVATLWDDVAGQLFVYDSASFEEPDVAHAVQWLVIHMRMRQYRVDRILCNDKMCQANEGAEKTLQRLFRDAFVNYQQNGRKVEIADGRLSESVHFDQWGAISQLNKLVANKQIFFDAATISAYNQIVSWSVENGKPGTENTGYCEALCLIVSELRRRKVFEQTRRPGDYMRKEALEQKLREDPILQGRR